MKKFYLMVASVILLSCGAGLLFAEQQEPEFVTNIDEVVVTAGRVDEKKWNVPVNITVITTEDIAQSTGRNIGDLLAEDGTGHIHKYPGGLTSVGIRGFRTDSHGNDLLGHVLVLVNGRRAATGNVAKIPLENVERVEIIRGPAATQYGSAAMGGVINIITLQGKDKPSVFLDQAFGSYGYQKTSAGLSGKVGIFDFSGSLARSEMDAYEIADGDKYPNTGFDHKIYGSLNLGLEFIENNRIGIIYNYYDADEIGNPNYFSNPDFDNYKDSSNKSFDVVYDGMTPTALFAWKVRYFQTKDQDIYYDPIASNPSGYGDGIPSKNTTDQKGAQAQLTWNYEESSITTGVDWTDYDIKSTFTPQKTTYENPAVFLLGTTGFFDETFIINGGIRYDKYDLKVEEPTGNDKSEDSISPTIGLVYHIADNWKLRAVYGEAFVMPAAQQLAANYTSYGTHTVGNPDLDPEKSKTYEAGVDFLFGPFTSSLTGFYTHFKDKIVRSTLPNGDSSWQNFGKAKLSGFEGDFSLDIGSFFNWSYEVKPFAKFVWMTEYKDEETDNDLQYISDCIISYGISVSDMEGFFAKLNVSYFGPQKITDYEFGTYDVMTKSGFTTADFVISQKIIDSDKYGDLILRGEINNIFNEDYAFVQGYPMPGRNFYIGLRYEY